MAKTVLVVDDDAYLRKTLVAILRSLYEVVEAANGKDALDLVGSKRPDLVLLDMTMPDLSGIEVLAALRKARQAVPVLMLTAEQDIGLARQSLDLGASAYITKPFEPATLLSEVGRVLDRAAAGPLDDKPWRVV
ncbi:MAG: response regulator [Elusimicrobia bacterium]|nr:response regulator [Elusimicrobiota bacterium]